MERERRCDCCSYFEFGSKKGLRKDWVRPSILAKQKYSGKYDLITDLKRDGIGLFTLPIKLTNQVFNVFFRLLIF